MRTIPLFTGVPVRALFLACLAGAAVAQDRTTEKGEAQITDPNQECTPYTYPPTASQLGNFPPIFTVASVLANDSEAIAMWNSISGKIPTNIEPKGLPNGSTIGVTNYNDTTDPDCWWTIHQCTTPKLAGLPNDISVVPEPRTLGYAFDDGPNCSHNAFYDFLASQNQQATFFYIGSNVMLWPLEAQRAFADGHEISAHTWSHHYMTSLSSEDAFAELWYSLKAIKVATGVTPTSWRPPYGDVDDRIRSIANALGLSTVVWAVDSRDWDFPTITQQAVDTDYQNLINNVTAGTYNTQGTIMLTHELNNFTMSEAVKWHSGLMSAFSHIVPIGVAYNKTQPYLETNFTQSNFSQYAAGQVGIKSSGAAPLIFGGMAPLLVASVAMLVGLFL
ncbi:chitin deacetylase [Artomyces pyxidatus]|uniref:Chitin deacetylase n=1 Tax=Artomyces pyxidatus TaxID=48021 RepID=A0ACB8SIM5_9AGAM|nr:chitin deacetylase [Artomyces pyxidatus]